MKANSEWVRIWKVITGWLFLAERLQIIPLDVLDSLIGVNFDKCFI